MAVVELTPEDVKAMKVTREVQPSPYQSDVDAAKPGKVYGIYIEGENRSARSIVNNLQKAADASGVKIKVQVREKASKPVVMFSLIDTDAASPAESEPATTEDAPASK